jgi:creatinine amidohydrolase/Fe(II)-dependent formamide hydrolase-like protein
MGMCRLQRPKACWALRSDISTGSSARVYSPCAGSDGSTFEFLRSVRSSAKSKSGLEAPEGRNFSRRGVILMPTKADLEHRVAVLEEALEEACDLIKDVLETDDENESAD